MTRSAESLLERDSALAALDEQALRADRGRGGLVLVSGEAGLGKTVLIRHFIESRDDLSLVCGYGEPTSTARPLGIIHDLALSMAGALRERLKASTLPWQLYEALLEDLSTLPGLPVIWIEDVHWADQATLETLRYLIRRCSSLRLLLIVTLRKDASHAQLARDSLLTGIPIDQWQEISLARLSESAVVKMAAASGRDGHTLYELTRGNPLFLSSTLRWGQDSVPETLTRLAHQKLQELDAEPAELIRLLSTHPRRIESSLLRRLPQATDEALTICREQRWLLELDDCLVFEHELLRRAVLDSLSTTERRRLHALMLEQPLTLAQAIHHALNAQDWARLKVLAPQAAEESMRAKAFREAAEYWQLALNHSDMAEPQRAHWYDQLGWSLVHSGESVAGRTAIEQARQLWLSRGDVGGILRNLANALRWPARVRLLIPMFSNFEIEDALRFPEHSDQAFDRAVLLVELARRASLAGRFDETRSLLERVRSFSARVVEPDQNIELRWWICWLEAYFLRQIPSDDLDEIIGQSAVRELDHFAVQAQVLGALVAMASFDIETSVRRCVAGLAYCEKRDLNRFASLFKLAQSHQLMMRSEFDKFLTLAEALLGPISEFPPGEQHVKINLTLVKARTEGVRGSPDLPAALDVIRRTGHTMMKFLALSGAVEIYWLEGDRQAALACAHEVVDLLAKLRAPVPDGMISLMLDRLGVLASVPNLTVANPTTPHLIDGAPEARQFDGHSWLLRGMPYEAALAFARGSANDRRQAVALLKKCGANNTIARLQQEWAAFGDGAVPRGARSSTSRNPAGLTSRELQVLRVLCEGLNNADIALRLHRSPRTVEHHLAAILTKTGSKSRHDAINWARSHGLS